MTTSCGGYVQRHTDQGDAYYKDRKYHEAIAEYTKAIRFSPDNPRLVRQLGLAHFRVVELQNAYNYLSKSELLKPGDPDVRVSLGQIYLANHRPDDAAREAQAVLTSDPRNADALDLLATASLLQRNPAKAVEAYRRLVDLFPKSAKRHYALGVGLMTAQQNTGARKEFETALALAPDHVDALTRLVNLDLLEKRQDDALPRVQKQIAVAGRNPKLVMLLASVQAARGNQAAAEEAYREAIQLDQGHADASVALANFYVKAGKLDQALPVVESALKTEKSASAYQLRGIILQSKGDVQGARQAYEQALALNPSSTEAANNLAWLLSEKLGDDRQAFQLAELANQLAPDDPHIADTFGWIVYRMGDFKRAATLLTASAEKLPDVPGIQYHLGAALLQTGDTVGARRALTRAVSSTAPFGDRDAAQKALSTLR